MIHAHKMVIARLRSVVTLLIDYIANEVFSADTDYITGSDYIKNQVFS